MGNTHAEMYQTLLDKAFSNFQKEVATIPSRIAGAIRQAEYRRDVSLSVLEGKRVKQQLQDDCSHHHDVGHETCMTFIYGADYLFCQKCEAHIDATHSRFDEWLVESLAAEKEAMAEFASREPVSPEEDALYAMSMEELRGK